MTSAGTIAGPSRYQGVTVDYLCDLVGGVNESNSIRVTAKDGYSMSFTYNQLNGDFHLRPDKRALKLDNTELLSENLSD